MRRQDIRNPTREPNDTDYYEGRFAVEDTCVAVREARRLHDCQPPGALATALPAIYRQIVASN